MPGLVPFWLLLPALSIIAGREARRRWCEADSRAWRWMAVSGSSLAWFSLISLVPIVVGASEMLYARASSNTNINREELRELQAAEEQYHRVTGAFASLECLGDPVGCAGERAGRLPAARPELVARERAGFRRYFVAGPGEGPRSGARLRSYALVAVPLVGVAEASLVRPWTGRAALCADSTGRLCQITGGFAFLGESRCPGPATPPDAQGQGWTPPCQPSER